MQWFHTLTFIASLFARTEGSRSFVIRDDQFMKDDKSFNLRSGSLHYFRVPPAYWRDRIQRLKSLGLNSVTTYVPWNFHEEEEGKYTFSGQANVSSFLQLVQEEGLLVIFRPGPYICALAYLLRVRKYSKPLIYSGVTVILRGSRNSSGVCRLRGHNSSGVLGGA